MISAWAESMKLEIKRSRFNHLKLDELHKRGENPRVVRPLQIAVRLAAKKVAKL